MIGAAKEWLKARWPRLSLRTIVFATLFTVAALPGIAAMFLRVYENTLVRQTEAELVAQGAALAAAAAAQWPGAGPATLPDPRDLRPEVPTIDLSSTSILPERPAPRAVSTEPNPQALAAARALAPVIARTRQVTLSAIVLLDRQGLVAADGEARSLAALPEVRAALAGRPETVLRRNGDYRANYNFEWLSRAAALRVHHARPVVVKGRVVGVLLLSRSARALFKGLYADRGKIAFGMAAIFGLLVVLSGVLSRGIVRPVEALARASRALASGRQEDVPDPPRTAAIEIQALYTDFALMAEAIERRSRYGSRLSGIQAPKPLVEVAGVTLLEWSVRQIAAAGIMRAVVVTGHRADEIEARLPWIAQATGVALEPCRLADWSQPNGNSVIAGSERISGNYLLVMADYLFSAALLQQLVTGFGRSSGAALAIDRKVDGPAIDPADATWVRCGATGHITQIGKHLTRYDAVDCGAFIATPDLARAISESIAEGASGSLSEGMQRLAEKGLAETVDVTGAAWIDVDDPAMLALAEAMAPAILPLGAATPVSDRVAA
jgi:choline kinase